MGNEQGTNSCNNDENKETITEKEGDEETVTTNSILQTETEWNKNMSKAKKIILDKTDEYSKYMPYTSSMNIPWREYDKSNKGHNIFNDIATSKDGHGFWKINCDLTEMPYIITGYL